jgi:hypothetical protein
VRARWLTVPALVAAYGAQVLRLPVAGWSPTGENQGVGPVTRRLYWIDIAAPRRPATEIVDAVLQHLPAVIPAVLASFRRVREGGGRTGVGDRFTILMLGSRRGRVQVTEVTPTHFRMQTLRQHSESGWIEFRSDPLAEGGYRLSVITQVRASSWFDRVAYLLGVGVMQRLTWESGLRSALHLSGGDKVGHGTTTVEWP